MPAGGERRRATATICLMPTSSFGAMGRTATSCMAGSRVLLAARGNTMTALGSHEWFVNAIAGATQMPIGPSENDVSVNVFVANCISPPRQFGFCSGQAAGGALTREMRSTRSPAEFSPYCTRSAGPAAPTYRTTECARCVCASACDGGIAPRSVSRSVDVLPRIRRR